LTRLILTLSIKVKLGLSELKNLNNTILEFLIASILLTISPGPDIIYVLVVSLRKGFKAGFILSCGLVSGVLIHTSLVAFGVSGIIKASENLYLFIKLLGASYLLYLAYKVYRSPAELSINYDMKRKTQNLFVQGFIMNVLNPKVTLFFLAFFPIFLWDIDNNRVAQFYILGVLFMLQALIIFGLVAYLCRWLNHALTRYKKAGIVLKYLQIFVFIFISLYILIDHEY